MLNVSAVTQQLREIIQDNSDLQNVWIYGRISEVRPTHNGNLNFTLTDSDEKIECVIFNDWAPLQENLPSVGNNVFVKGQIYVYETRSRYRFWVTDVNLYRNSSASQTFSIGDLTNTLRSTLTGTTGRIQGKIAKVFITPTDYTILNLKDIAADEQTNDIIECALLPGIDSPFSLQQGDVITVEGEFDIFAPICAYRIIINSPNELSSPSSMIAEPTLNRCQQCGEQCEFQYELCPMCYYAQLDHEGIVIGAVVRYFNAPRFANFSTEREHWIRLVGHIKGRADVILRRDNEERLSAIAECKRIGYDGNDGIDQLKAYLIASQTKLGLFADSTDSYEWTFLKRNDERNRYDKITRSEFERELGVDSVPERSPNQTRLELIHGNIIESEVDAIVNAADSNLTRGTGVDRAIREVGGEEIERECQEIFDREGVCPPGRAIITTGGNLAKYIIHAVGPIYDDGEQGEARTLARCYENSLKIAIEKRIRSVAFPAISTGNYGYPIEEAADIALTTVKEFVEQARQQNKMVPNYIQFVLFDTEAYTCYVNAFSKLGLGLFSFV